jgi:hypothetical protein
MLELRDVLEDDIALRDAKERDPGTACDIERQLNHVPHKTTQFGVNLSVRSLDGTFETRSYIRDIKSAKKSRLF